MAVNFSGSLIISGSIITTSGFTGSFSGSMSGTATSASAAISASYATSASAAVSSSYSISASVAVSSSYATSASDAATASFTPNAMISASISGPTISFSKGNASTFLLTVNNVTSASYATSASAAVSAAGDILDVMVYSYQVGAMSGIGGQGVGGQIAYYNTTNSITGSSNFSIVGSTINVTGSMIVSSSSTFTNIGPAVFSGSVTAVNGFTGSFSGTASSAESSSYALCVSKAPHGEVRPIPTLPVEVIRILEVLRPKCGLVAKSK